MGKPTEFLSETIKGGIFFVIPLTVALIILAKAHAFLKELTAPIAYLLPHNILGINGGVLIAFAALVLACFLGGLLIKSDRVKNRVDIFEDNVLSRIPGYTFFKSAISDTLDAGNKSMQAVMVPDDMSFTLGLVIEQNGNLCTVYIPGAPNASSGEVKIYDIKDIMPVNVQAKDVIASFSRLGKGSSQWLKDAQNQNTVNN